MQAGQEKKQEPEVCRYAIVSSQTADKGERGEGGDEHSQAWSEYRKEGKMSEMQIVCWALIFPAPEWALGCLLWGHPLEGVWRRLEPKAVGSRIHSRQRLVPLLSAAGMTGVKELTEFIYKAAPRFLATFQASDSVKIQISILVHTNPITWFVEVPPLKLVG